MIDKTLLGYAILEYYSDKDLDILDAYIPLFCSCIIESNLENVDRDIMQKCLIDKYGFDGITLGAIDSILQRMKKEGFLVPEKGKLIVDQQNITKYIEERPAEHLEENFECLVNDILSFSKETISVEFEYDQIKNGVLDFLDVHDGDILIESSRLTDVLAKQKEKKTVKYVISKYVLEAYSSKPEFVGTLMKLAKGHAISQVVTLNNFDAYIGKLDRLKVALDAPIIFNMLGLNGLSNYNLILELLNILKANKASFIIFNQNYNEVVNTINDAIWRLKSQKFDLDKSSRVLKFAVRNHKNASFLQTKLQQIDQLLIDWKIAIEDAPDSEKGYKEIDAALLSELISRKYTNNGEIPLEEYMEDLISTDVDTISYIFRYRGKTPTINLKQCKALLLTTNRAIAFASQHHSISTIHHAIPACVTDVFLSTILWAAYPGKNKDLNDKVFLSECYSNTTLDDAILKSYYNRVRELNRENRITNEQVLLLTSNKIAIDLLEKKTLNDPDRYTDATPEEILQNIEFQLNRERDEQKAIVNRGSNRIRKLSHKIAVASFWTIWLMVAGAFSIKYIDTTDLTRVPTLIIISISVATGFWGILSWAGKIKSKANIIKDIEEWTFNAINNWLYKED